MGAKRNPSLFCLPDMKSPDFVDKRPMAHGNFRAIRLPALKTTARGAAPPSRTPARGRDRHRTALPAAFPSAFPSRLPGLRGGRPPPGAAPSAGVDTRRRLSTPADTRRLQAFRLFKAWSSHGGGAARWRRGLLGITRRPLRPSGQVCPDAGAGRRRRSRSPRTSRRASRPVRGSSNALDSGVRRELSIPPRPMVQTNPTSRS